MGKKNLQSDYSQQSIYILERDPCSNMRPTLKVLQRAVHSGSVHPIKYTLLNLIILVKKENGSLTIRLAYLGLYTKDCNKICL